MPQQALELWVEVAVVLDALDVVSLGHPLDVQARQRDRQRGVRKHGLGKRIRRADYRAGAAESTLDLLPQPLEQMDVLGLLARELQQGADSIVVSLQLWPGVIEHKRENEFLDQSEYVEVCIPSDLVQRPAFIRSQE